MLSSFGLHEQPGTNKSHYRNHAKRLGIQCPTLYDDAQKMFTNTTLISLTYYMAVLSEYFRPFATVRNNSQWLLPTFTSVVGGMCWSRMNAANGYASWGPSKSRDIPPAHPWLSKRSDIYYYVQDDIISTKPNMHTTWLLYLILTAQAMFGVAAFIAAFSFYQALLKSGFSMIAILASVRQRL